MLLLSMLNVPCKEKKSKNEVRPKVLLPSHVLTRKQKQKQLESNGVKRGTMYGIHMYVVSSRYDVGDQSMLCNFDAMHE